MNNLSPSSKDVLCLCKSLVTIEDLFQHINKCSSFLEKYTVLYEAIYYAISSCKTGIERDLLISLIFLADRALKQKKLEDLKVKKYESCAVYSSAKKHISRCIECKKIISESE